MNIDPRDVTIQQAEQQSQAQTPAPKGGFDPRDITISPNSTTAPSMGTVGSILAGVAGANSPALRAGARAIANSPAASAIQDKVLAAGSGAQNAMANEVGNIPGGQNAGSALQAPGITDQARQDNPYTAAAGSIVGAVAGASAMIGGMTALGPGGLLTDVAANAITGSLLGGEGNRVMGGGLGAATATIAPVVSNIASFVAKSATIANTTKEVIGKINSMIDGTPGEVAAKSQANMWKAASANEKTMFDAFRNVEGNVEAGPVVSKAANFLNDNSDTLTSTQQRSVQDLIQNTANAKNLADLHDARKIFSYDFSKFTEGKPLTGEASQQFQSLNNTISSVMKNNADELGVGTQFAEANKYYQTQVMPLMNTGAKDTFDALNNASKAPMDAAKITDNLINKYTNPNKPEIAKAFMNSLDPTGQDAVGAQMVNNALTKATSKGGQVDFVGFKNNIQMMQDKLPGSFSDNTTNMINGLKTTIDQATHLLGTEVNTAKMGATGAIMSRLGAVGVVGGAGAAIGGATGGQEGAEQGGIMGVAAATMALGLGKLISTPMGQKVLQSASSPGGSAIGKNIVNSIMLNAALMWNPNRKANQ